MLYFYFILVNQPKEAILRKLNFSCVYLENINVIMRNLSANVRFQVTQQTNDIDRAKSQCGRQLLLLLLRTHVQRTISRCFAALRQLRQTRRWQSTFRTLEVALVHSKWDNGNDELVCLPARLLAASCPVCIVRGGTADMPTCALRHNTLLTAFICLQWLHLSECNQFKITVITYRVLHRSSR
jgi:hypothetical protein